MEQTPTVGRFPEWIHGARDCASCRDPLLQVHRFDPDTFILRISKCFSFEGNFLYLLFGQERAILFDTGGPADPECPVKVLPLRETIDAIAAQWLAERGRSEIDLVVAHTHGHEDHIFWDSQFAGRPRTTVVEPELEVVQRFFGLPDWPAGEAQFELGDRSLTLIPTPGHEKAHLAIYDRRCQVLLTGDLLYPGLLTVRSWPDFRASAARLAAFALTHEIALVLGNHIEMKKSPGDYYELPCRYQPQEHSLELGPAHLLELHAACEAMAASPHREVRAEFVIELL